MSKQKVTLMTGGAGFLGSHICDRLIERGHKVICADNFITGKKANIAHLLKDRNFSLIRHDVSKPLKVAGKVDYVMHCASPASPVDYTDHPVETLMVGSRGTQNMLDIAPASVNSTPSAPVHATGNTGISNVVHALPRPSELTS